jgi:hypothetical protein
MPTLTNDPTRLKNIKTVLANTFENLIRTKTPKESAAEVLLHTVLSHADLDPEPTPTTKKPLGYVVVYHDGKHMGEDIYDTSGIVNGVFSSAKLAQQTFEERVKETACPYFIAPVYPVDLTPIN